MKTSNYQIQCTASCHRMWYNIVYQNKVESQTISTKFDPQLSLLEWRCKFGSHSQTLDEYLQPTLHDMVCMLTSGESSCTFFENKWTANDRCGNRRCVCTWCRQNIPGKTIMLSSCVKRTPLLWLHDKSHLRLSSLYIRTTKNIRMKWFGISLAIL